MDVYEAKSGLMKYVKSRWSVANDDCLKQHIQSIPSGITLQVCAMTTDSIGNNCPAGFIAEKVDADHWTVREHWFHADGATIPDSAIAHDLTWLLRCRQVKINCSQK